MARTTPTTTATPTASDRLTALEAEWERIVADLGNARERLKDLRLQRVEALGGDPNARRARALDGEITSVRHDIQTLEELMEDLAPRRAALAREVKDTEMAAVARVQAEKQRARAQARLELVGLMAQVRKIADEHSSSPYSTPFAGAPADLCRLARSSAWLTYVADEAERDLARAERTLAGGDQ